MKTYKIQLTLDTIVDNRLDVDWFEDLMSARLEDFGSLGNFREYLQSFSIRYIAERLGLEYALDAINLSIKSKKLDQDEVDRLERVLDFGFSGCGESELYSLIKNSMLYSFIKRKFNYTRLEIEAFRKVSKNTNKPM